MYKCILDILYLIDSYVILQSEKPKDISVQTSTHVLNVTFFLFGSDLVLSNERITSNEILSITLGPRSEISLHTLGGLTILLYSHGLNRLH